MTEELHAVLEESRRLGFLGPGPVDDHIAHAERFCRLVGDVSGSFVDLGSGGGVPGLVALAVWPQASGVLLDAQAKRCAFLRRSVVDLGWAGRTTIVEDRAERAGRVADLREAADLVLVRSFGPPAPTAECAAAFVRPGGRVAVSEPPSGSEARWPAAGLAVLGLELEVLRHDDGVHVAVLRKVAPLDDRYPRADGVPGKRPLF